MDASIVKHLETPAELDEVSQVLLKAAALIEGRGLAKHVLMDRVTGALCARGAIFEAVGGDPFDWKNFYPDESLSKRADNRLAHAVYSSVRAEYYGTNFWDAVPTWSNAPETTEQEVISTMRRVALTGC